MLFSPPIGHSYVGAIVVVGEVEAGIGAGAEVRAGVRARVGAGVGAGAGAGVGAGVGVGNGIIQASEKKTIRVIASKACKNIILSL